MPLWSPTTSKAVRTCPRVTVAGVWYRSVDGELFRRLNLGQTRCQDRILPNHGLVQRLELLLLICLGQDGDVLRAGLLGDGHEVDRLA
jgi:hypothetical protein